jgi:hypothetical protein
MARQTTKHGRQLVIVLFNWFQQAERSGQNLFSRLSPSTVAEEEKAVA